MSFDPTKPVQTRNGRKARIICTDVKRMSFAPDLCIVALITDPNNGFEYEAYRELNGKYPGHHELSPHDLVNVPVKRSEWQNVWKRGAQTHYRYISKESALETPNEYQQRIGLLRFDFEDDVLVNVELESI